MVAVELPRDDAGHPAPIEWWYWVGHLEDADGRRLAFQLTFFKAYAPPQLRILGLPANLWFEKGHVAHAAVVDLDAGEHVMRQRIDFFYEADASYRDLDAVVGPSWGATRRTRPRGASRCLRSASTVQRQLTRAIGSCAAVRSSR